LATLATKTKTAPAQKRTKVRVGAPVDETLWLLKRYYPDAHCALHHKTSFQLLIATILSAQCTDDRVNQVTPHLFARYPSAFEMAQASIEDLEGLVRSTGFYKNKARSLKACSKALVEKHQGEVPRDLNQLTELAGVGRKTANVVLGNAYGITSGIVVDTHVTRLSNRLGWTKSENPVVIEQDLQKRIPEEDWIQISHWLIYHGRQVCKARKPSCDTCFLFEQCPKILKTK
jgi:endonuclease-3